MLDVFFPYVAREEKRVTIAFESIIKKCFPFCITLAT